MVVQLLFVSFLFLANKHTTLGHQNSNYGCQLCDPEATDFNKVANQIMPDKFFDEQTRFMGSFYENRWYLEQSANVSSEIWSRAVTHYIDPDKPDQMMVMFHTREKDNYYCNDPVLLSSNRIRPGKYLTSLGPITVTATFIYQTDTFAVEIICYEPQGDACKESSAYFWSRTRIPRPEDILAGEKVLRSICYPYMNRFIDTNHDIDCIPDSMR